MKVTIIFLKVTACLVVSFCVFLVLASCNASKISNSKLDPLASVLPSVAPSLPNRTPNSPPANAGDPLYPGADGDADPADAVALGELVSCDLIVIGGTAAAYASAFSAAWIWKQANINNVVCLTEPTDWVGGQLTSGGVSAVDFANYTTEVNGKLWAVNDLSKKLVNMPQQFASWMNALAPTSGGFISSYANPGRCWVSNLCYAPQNILPLMQADLVSVASHLKVLYNTVPKRVRRKTGKILNVDVVSRTSTGAAPFVPNSLNSIWDTRASQMAADWYSEKDSANFRKKRFTLGKQNGFPIVIDGSEFGDILALARAKYIQGAERQEGKIDDIPDTCSQAITVPLAIERQSGNVAVPSWLGVKSALFDLSKFNGTYFLTPPGGTKVYSFEKVWSYRRIVSRGNKLEEVVVGDVSMQNWGTGNDYGDDAFLLSRADAEKTRADWVGGINLKTWDLAEQKSLGWFLHLRNLHESGPALALARNFGTHSGLSKLPYLRDTRRSLGIDGFLLFYAGEKGILNGADFGEENAALGAYVADIHSPNPKHCGLPSYLNSVSITPMPYHLPLRALTNSSIKNLLVAGKTMAQTFFANSSTRVHPSEFSSGVAAGILGGYLVEINKDMHEAWAQRTEENVKLFVKFAQRASLRRDGAELLPRKWTE